MANRQDTHAFIAQLPECEWLPRRQFLPQQLAKDAPVLKAYPAAREDNLAVTQVKSVTAGRYDCWPDLQRLPVS